MKNNKFNMYEWVLLTKDIYLKDLNISLTKGTYGVILDIIEENGKYIYLLEMDTKEFILEYAEEFLEKSKT